MRIVYKIMAHREWIKFKKDGVFKGSRADLADGYIHFSNADQVAMTAAKHFAGQDDLVILAIAAVPLGNALRDEASRGGALFPHLYGDLPYDAILWAKPAPLAADGTFLFPPLALD